MSMRSPMIMLSERGLLAITAAFVLSVPLADAQSEPTSGLYEIVSGDYTACCGIAGETRWPVPNEEQNFVRLTVDPQAKLATMAFLGRDLQTVFSVLSCPIGDPVPFLLNYGFIYSNSITFLVNPGPPPYELYWHYLVDYSTNSLQINGALGMAGQGCADVPTAFGHSNVVAQLVTGPRMSVMEYSKEGALLFIQGHDGWTNVIEASTNLVSWTPISTNLMPSTTCPICPYIMFRDPASTNLARRFYRSFEFP
jgi:hypothetical protein